jgi:hypothetical protein
MLPSMSTHLRRMQARALADAPSPLTDDSRLDARLARIERLAGERTSLWAGLGVGLGASALIITLILLLRRPRQAASAPVAGAAQLPPHSPVEEGFI